MRPCTKTISLSTSKQIAVLWVIEYIIASAGSGHGRVEILNTRCALTESVQAQGYINLLTSTIHPQRHMLLNNELTQSLVQQLWLVTSTNQ